MTSVANVQKYRESNKRASGTRKHLRMMVGGEFGIVFKSNHDNAFTASILEFQLKVHKGILHRKQ
jgi:hypothetical protein